MMRKGEDMRFEEGEGFMRPPAPGAVKEMKRGIREQIESETRARIEGQIRERIEGQFEERMMPGGNGGGVDGRGSGEYAPMMPMMTPQEFVPPAEYAPPVAPQELMPAPEPAPTSILDNSLFASVLRILLRQQ